MKVSPFGLVASILGVACVVINVILHFGIAADEDKALVPVVGGASDAVAALVLELIALVAALLCAIVWLFVALLDLELCCCVGLVTKTMLVAGLKAKATIVKALLVLLSVLAVIGAIIYLILFGIINTSATTAVLIVGVVAVVILLVNLIMVILYCVL